MTTPKSAGIYQKVFVHMWNDPRILALGDRARLLYVRLLTGPEMTCIPGVVVCSKGQIADAMGWKPRALTDTIATLGPMVEAYWDSRLVWLPDAVEGNLPTSPNTVIAWERASVRVVPSVAFSKILTAIGSRIREEAPHLSNVFAERFPEQSPGRSGIDGPRDPRSTDHGSRNTQHGSGSTSHSVDDGLFRGGEVIARKDAAPQPSSPSFSTRRTKLHNDAVAAATAEGIDGEHEWAKLCRKDGHEPTFASFMKWIKSGNAKKLPAVPVTADDRAKVMSLTQGLTGDTKPQADARERKSSPRIKLPDRELAALAHEQKEKRSMNGAKKP